MSILSVSDPRIVIRLWASFLPLGHGMHRRKFGTRALPHKVMGNILWMWLCWWWIASRVLVLTHQRWAKYSIVVSRLRTPPLKHVPLKYSFFMMAHLFWLDQRSARLSASHIGIEESRAMSLCAVNVVRLPSRRGLDI